MKFPEVKRVKSFAAIYELATKLLSQGNASQIIIMLCGTQSERLLDQHDTLSIHEDVQNNFQAARDDQLEAKGDQIEADSSHHEKECYKEVEDTGKNLMHDPERLKKRPTKNCLPQYQLVKLNGQYFIKRRKFSQSSVQKMGRAPRVSSNLLSNKCHSHRVPKVEHANRDKNSKSECSLHSKSYSSIKWPHGCPTHRITHRASKSTTEEQERHTIDNKRQANDPSLFDSNSKKHGNGNVTTNSQCFVTKCEDVARCSAGYNTNKRSATNYSSRNSNGQQGGSDKIPDPRPFCLTMHNAALRAAKRRRGSPPPASGGTFTGCNCAKCRLEHPNNPLDPLDCTAIRHAAYCESQQNKRTLKRIETTLCQENGPPKHRRQHYIDNSVEFHKRKTTENHESSRHKFMRIFKSNAPTRQVVEGNVLTVDKYMDSIPFPTFIFIGLTRQKLMSIQFYITRTKEWTLPLDMEVPFRKNFASVQHNGHVFVCGGEDENGNTLKTCFSYNVSASKVVARNDLRVARSHATAIAYDHSIFVVGGKNSNDVNLSNIEVLDHRDLKSTWRILKTMRGPHCNPGAAMNSVGNFFVVGGYSNLCECHVDQEDAWRELSSLPSRYSNHGTFCTIHNNLVYIFVDHLPKEVAILDPLVNVVYVTPTRGQPPDHITSFYNNGDEFLALDEKQYLFAYNANMYTWRLKCQLRNDLLSFLSMTVISEEKVPFVSRQTVHNK